MEWERFIFKMPGKPLSPNSSLPPRNFPPQKYFCLIFWSKSLSDPNSRLLTSAPISFTSLCREEKTRASKTGSCCLCNLTANTFGVAEGSAPNQHVPAPARVCGMQPCHMLRTKQPLMLCCNRDDTAKKQLFVRNAHAEEHKNKCWLYWRWQQRI